jgi:YD repeat-containing protein
LGGDPTLDILKQSGTVAFIAVPSPFRQVRICRDFPPGLSIAHMLGAVGLEPDVSARIFVGDRLIPDNQRGTVPLPGQLITVRALATGGQGKNQDEILLQFGIMAVTAIATWGVGALATAALPALSTTTVGSLLPASVAAYLPSQIANVTALQLVEGATKFGLGQIGKIVENALKPPPATTAMRLASQTDPLNRTDTYVYDAMGNVISGTDARGKTTIYGYDGLKRLTFVGFGANNGSYESTIAYTYDSANRITQIVDSQAGTITRTYDSLDDLTSEVTPLGTVSYTYDNLGRRLSMTLTGQPPVTYSYDNTSRVTSVTQGSTSVAISYDGKGRRSTVILPNNILASVMSLN